MERLKKIGNKKENLRSGVWKYKSQCWDNRNPLRIQIGKKKFEEILKIHHSELRILFESVHQMPNGK